jgi:hypothetical protein
MYWASERALEIGDQGAADDCAQLLEEIDRLMHDSLRGGSRGRRRLSGTSTHFGKDPA